MGSLVVAGIARSIGTDYSLHADRTVDKYGLVNGDPKANSVFYAPLTTDLAVVRGTGTPVFTRASTKTLMCYDAAAVNGDPMTRATLAVDEAGFYGTRRVSEGVYSTVYADGSPIVDTLYGYYPERESTQYLGETDTPATQTTGELAAGTYCLWVEGSGSAIVTAGTATISGAVAVTQGAYDAFTVSAPGTVVVTVTGSLTIFQLEDSATPTSYIPNPGVAGTTVTRAKDVLTYTGVSFPADQANETWYCEYVMHYLRATYSWMLLRAAGVNYRLMQVNPANNNRVLAYHDAEAHGADSTLATVANQLSKAAFTCTPTALTVYRNNRTGTVGAMATQPAAATDLDVGHGNIAQGWNVLSGIIREIHLFDGILTDITAVP